MKISSKDNEGFDVEPETSSAPPAEVFEHELSAMARYILLIVFTLNRKVDKEELLRLCEIGQSTWLKYTRELVDKGWLIRINHGGGGKGIWRHERRFLRKPIPDPLA